MCTRLVYFGDGGRVITARSMDWKSELDTHLWAFPKGMARDGAAGERSLTWTSKFGSVIASGYEVSTTDGLNEAGLAANVLWLVESHYGRPASDVPLIAISLWAQYVLDMFATVAEAVEALSKEEFSIATAGVPGDEQRLATMHLSISDASGDSAIFEYIDGALVIHHDRDYQVMTNSPTFDEQLAITSYWQQIGGTIMLPGTNRAADRFVRASFYVNAIPQVEDQREALTSVLSVIRNVSVPFGITTAQEPNISSTRWRTLSDHKDLTYFFDATSSIGGCWVSLDDLDLSEGAPTLRLDLTAAADAGRTGDAAAQFEPHAPMVFLGV